MRTQEEIDEALVFLRKATIQSHHMNDEVGEVSARMCYEVLQWATGENNVFFDGLKELRDMPDAGPPNRRRGRYRKGVR